MKNTPANIQKYTEASKHALKYQTARLFFIQVRVKAWLEALLEAWLQA